MRQFKVGDRVTLHDEEYVLNDTQKAGTVAGIVVSNKGEALYEVDVDNYEFITLAFFAYELQYEEETK